MIIEGAGAFVTGGGSGLGEAVARMLAARGAVVHLFDRNRDAAEKVAGEIGATAHVGDVVDEVSAGNALAAAAKSGNGLRILVNCAGIGTAGRILGREAVLPLTDFEKVIRVNLIGTFNMMRLAAEHMSKADELADHARGVIVNTASVAAFDGQVGQAAYAASKGGIVSLALPAARELARFGIRVNTVAPGIFLTPLLHTLPEEVQKSLAAQIPYPSRLGDPQEFADVVRFLIENQYINGEVIRLDGAVRMQPR
ncbi:SDR family NAD(P)-dependent oxidoreductase [Rhizobium sp. RU36D]|uniref:SDR family NAD(P)-dependent oxidoreductase n=1 Tax=Rhizobium sp. RU36D TaxID=1907415 RepID=UPI0009D7C1FE|nr:SDR family NAD(P)-dependent oxidoreductase [Rhizobium sp. RU36D]SMC86086.1 NAD(P)-dependent dehydrogenase, short-chain alcohol dehydrogenase family [Rhizobium sp. RU36D]